MTVHYFAGFMVNKGHSPDDYFDGSHSGAGSEGSPNSSASYYPFNYENETDIVPYIPPADTGVPRYQFTGILLEGTDLGVPTRSLPQTPGLNGTMDVIGKESYSALRKLDLKMRLEAASEVDLQLAIRDLEHMISMNDEWDLGLKPHPDTIRWTYFRILRSDAVKITHDRKELAVFRADVAVTLQAEPFSHGGVEVVYNARKIASSAPTNGFWPSEWSGGDQGDTKNDDGQWCFWLSGTDMPSTYVEWFDNADVSIGETTLFSGVTLRKLYKTIHHTFTPPSGAASARLTIGKLTSEAVDVSDGHRHYASMCIRKGTSHCYVHRILFGNGVIDSPGTLALGSLVGTADCELDIDLYGIEDVVSTVYITAIDDETPWHEELNAVGDSSLPDRTVSGARSSSGHALYGTVLNPESWSLVGRIHPADYPKGEYAVICRCRRHNFVQGWEHRSRDLGLRVFSNDEASDSGGPTTFSAYYWPRHGRWGWTWVGAGSFEVHPGARAKVQARISKLYDFDTFIVLPMKYGVLTFNTDIYHPGERRNEVHGSYGWKMQSKRDWDYTGGKPDTHGAVIVPPVDDKTLLVVASTDRESQISHETAPVALTVKYRPRYKMWVNNG